MIGSSLSFKKVVAECRWITTFLEMFLIRTFVDLFRTMASFFKNSMELEYQEIVELDVISNDHVWTQAMNGLVLCNQYKNFHKLLSAFSGSQPLWSVSYWNL